jgi:hypothetical protein
MEDDKLKTNRNLLLRQPVFIGLHTQYWSQLDFISFCQSLVFGVFNSDQSLYSYSCIKYRVISYLESELPEK